MSKPSKGIGGVACPWKDPEDQRPTVSLTGSQLSPLVPLSVLSAILVRWEVNHA